ncbi:hypothetical protein ACHAWT_005156 [Skeletonema menzelii]
MDSNGHVDPFAARGDNITANDEAIALAMAESMTSETNRSSTAKCPVGHGLELFQTSHVQKVKCNVCNRDLDGGSSNNPFATSSSHMATVPCVIGNISVEMLVDTGAQTSVLSMPIVRQLGLINRLDRRYMGVAAGVGQARISGKINNIICAFGVGHVEFPMDFIVLDIKDSLVILGLDQMRKYKCLVDMEREKLVFGGRGGIEVDMLPANQQHIDFRGLSGGCIMM